MRFSITIPKPCNEPWDAMSERASGRFCASCQHEVADLSRASDAELLALFTSDAQPKCARFDAHQLDRVLGAHEARQRRGLPLAAFTSLLAIAIGQETLAQGAPVLEPHPAHQVMPVVGKPAIDGPRTPARPDRTITGRVTEAGSGVSVPFATVTMVGTELRAVADMEGRFTLRIPGELADGTVVLACEEAGFRPFRKALPTMLVEGRTTDAGVLELDPRPLVLGEVEIRQKR